MSFPVAEKFVSINGESVRAGEVAAFIRFRGCNLSCSFCSSGSPPVSVTSVIPVESAHAVSSSALIHSAGQSG